jgi:hypothetical protein
VVALEHKPIAPLQKGQHSCTDDARVGAAPDPGVIIPDAEPARLIRVVRGGERLDNKIADMKFAVVPAGVCLDWACRSPAVYQKVVQCPPGCIDRDIELSCEDIDPRNMVRMLMGHEDRTDIIGSFPGTIEAGHDLF